MSWDLAPECISTIFLSIIWIYSRHGNLTPSLKNRLFQLCFLTTFLAMTSNIISTILIYNLNESLILLAWIFNMIYFIATPLMGAIYYLYALATITERSEFPKKFMIVTLIPAFIYIILVIINPWTTAIYSISIESGYQQGPLILLTYIIFYLYCINSVLIVLWKGKYISKTIRRILISFPSIAVLVIIFQYLYPRIILSGSAATLALLLIYLYIQNKQISLDYLTQFPNRQEFLNVLSLHLRKNENRKFTIIVLSMKDFKRINDLYAQHIGDAFLASVSNYLKENFMQSDIRLFRYSGDEFALLYEQADEKRVTKIVSSITQRMSEPWFADKHTSMLNAAIGIVQYPESATSVEMLINGIEFSINLAKKDKLNNYICYCTSEILEKAKRYHKISYILKDCLSKQSFEVYYQPILDFESNRFTTAEALLRIPDSPIGPIYPDEFIPIAEENGLIIEITYLVLHKVCAMLQKMAQEDIEVDCIHVNFASQQFSQPNLVTKIMDILKQYDVSTDKINIEITERTLSENPEMMLNYALQLRKRGIKIDLDDFGVGYSNVSSVIFFPIHIIKLDKSLIYTAFNKEKAAILVENLTKAFIDMNFTVLAEGIETKEQNDFAKSCGCRYIQGYFYAKPLPSKEFINFMKNR